VSEGCEDEYLSKIAEKFLGLSRRKQLGVPTLYGRADLPASMVSKVDTRLYVDRGWPDNRGAQREIAALLAAESSLMLVDD
jgi:hypothetical protein